MAKWVELNADGCVVKTGKTLETPAGAMQVPDSTNLADLINKKLIDGQFVPLTQAEREGLMGTEPTGIDLVEAVKKEAQRRLDALVRPYKTGERETWTVQAREAHAFDADSAAETPFLDALIARSGEQKDQLVVRILANEEAFQLASAAIIGAQRAVLAMDPIPADFADDQWWP